MISGDKIKFGEEFCERTFRPYLLNKTIMLTPQLFEEDNGLFTYTSECPGIFFEEDDEPESIYHLFGNDLKSIYDCEVIPATDEDIAKIQKQQTEDENARNKEYEGMAEFYSKLNN
ncbi:hypothetical protein [Planomicrobium okeanokoites]|uniref:hypothetical protein n=1 Tax=Planomicrobium okeanokoites TaxID=244 RepID=UPI000A01B7D5|nr:hypothetical protein [Planomicrobium okeanokoites]